MTWDHRKKFQKEAPSAAAGAATTVAPGAGGRRGADVFTCPGCGVRTCGGMAYCPQCGSVLSQSCPHCEHQWRYEFQYSFCPACGGELPQREQIQQQAHGKPRRGAAWKAGRVTTVEEEGT